MFESSKSGEKIPPPSGVLPLRKGEKERHEGGKVLEVGSVLEGVTLKSRDKEPGFLVINTMSPKKIIVPRGGVIINHLYNIKIIKDTNPRNPSGGHFIAEITADVTELSRKKEIEKKVASLLQEADRHLKLYEMDKAHEIMKKIKELLKVDYEKETYEQVKQFKQFYREVFNLELDTKDLKIPELSKEQKETFKWLIIMPKGLTIDTIWNKVKEKMKTNPVNDPPPLDQSKSIRTTKNKSYAIWIKDNIEADVEFKNKPANQIQKEGINPITLEERLVLELFYNWKNPDKHLDLNNMTLAAGSRNSDGSVPYVNWSSVNQRLVVTWYVASYADGILRCREVISAP